jgi:hypothetical protein
VSHSKISPLFPFRLERFPSFFEFVPLFVHPRLSDELADKIAAKEEHHAGWEYCCQIHESHSAGLSLLVGGFRLHHQPQRLASDKIGSVN